MLGIARGSIWQALPPPATGPQDLDTDKDGQLSLSEHLAAAVQPSDDEEETEKHKEFETEKYRAADLNSDGLLSADEARALFFPILNEKVLAIEALPVLGASAG